MNNEWHTANIMNQDCGVTSATGGQEVIERARRREVLEKVQNTSTKDILQVFHALPTCFDPLFPQLPRDCPRDPPS
jgi:hypothetical protein